MPRFNRLNQFWLQNKRFVLIKKFFLFFSLIFVFTGKQFLFTTDRKLNYQYDVKTNLRVAIFINISHLHFLL